MLQKHKLPSLEAGILLILLATAIVGAGFFTSGNKIKKTEASVFRPEELVPNSQVTGAADRDEITGIAAGNELTGMASGGSEADETGEGIKIKGEIVRVKGMEKGEINVVV